MCMICSRNIDLEQFFLVFVISKKRFYHSLCSVTASHPDRREYVDENVPCTRLQNDSELQVSVSGSSFFNFPKGALLHGHQRGGT